MSNAMKRKSCLTMTPSFCCSLLPKAVCHFVLQSDVMEGTLVRDRDHKEERISETTCRFRAGFSSTSLTKSAVSRGIVRSFECFCAHPYCLASLIDCGVGPSGLRC